MKTKKTKSGTKKYEFTYADVDFGPRGMYIAWGCKNIGFGNLAIKLKPEDGILFDTECMSDEFVVALFKYIMSKSEIR